MGNFGRTMPQVERIQMPQSNLGQLGGAIGNLGNAVQNAAEKQDRQQQEAEISAKRLELYNNKVAEADAKVKLDDVLTSEMSEQVTLLKNEVANGTTNATIANETLKKWSDDRYKQIQGEIPGHAQKDLKQHWDSNVIKQAPGFLPLQLRADAQKSVVRVDRITEIATRYDRKTGREYLESNLASANLSEADNQSRLYKYETARDVMDIDGRISNAIAGKDTADLQTLITDLDSGKYGYVDGSTAQQKKSQALSRIDALNKQSEVEENKRVTKAGQVINEFKSQVLTGRDLDSTYKDTVGLAVKGTEHEAEYNFYSQQSANFQSFGRKSSSEQLTLINQQKAKAKNSKTTDAVNEEKILGVYESIYQEKVNVLKDNPSQVVREAGLEVNELSPIELKTDPKSWAKKAVDNGISQLALKDANVKLAPISKEDLPEAKKAFDAMGVNEKLNFIGDMVDQSKGVKNGSAIWGATLGQLGDGKLSYVSAGVARMNGYKSEKGEDVATAIISGTQALKNKQLIMPNDKLMKIKFNEYVGGTTSGKTANMTYESYRSIYAHIVERDNKYQSLPDVIDSDIAKTALSMATGGVYKQGIKLGGSDWKVSKPYGMKDENFEDRLERGYRVIANGTGMSVTELESLYLKRSDKRSAKGEIQYDLINERGNPLVVDGVAWRINMNGATK